MENWRLLHTWDAAPGFNMALDEALLVHPRAEPTLRFYTWRPAALSLGYFQRARDVSNLERAEACVRRLTGGGAIHHAAELTFSIAAAADHPLYAGAVQASYERVHDALRAALVDVGVAAQPRGEEPLPTDRAVGGMCFEHSTAFDLAWDGAKGVGSAQRRTRGRVLHHGSIKLGRSALDDSVATVHAYAPELDATGLADRVQAAFATRFGIAFERGEPDQAELEHVRERAGFFTSDAFVRRR